MKSPLFSTIGLRKAYSYVRSFELIKAEIGLPIESAMALLGCQWRATTAVHYEVFSNKDRRAHTQEQYADVRRELLKMEDVHGSPGGILFDIARINNNLSRDVKQSAQL